MSINNRQIFKNIASAIKNIRISKNMSQLDLSKKSGVSLASIVRFESGNGNISLMNFIAIIKTLNLIDKLNFLIDSQIQDIPPSILAKIEKHKRQRVRKSKKKLQDKLNQWKWDEDL